eukprot:1161665-Pelagomonas_calceolata.AAC.4
MYLTAPVFHQHVHRQSRYAHRQKRLDLVHAQDAMTLGNFKMMTGETDEEGIQDRLLLGNVMNAMPTLVGTEGFAVFDS